MKKTFLLAILLLTTLFPQTKWQKLNGPQGGFGNGLFAKGDTLIFNSSLPTIIFYSFDRGNSWKQANIRVPERITDYLESPDGYILAAGEYKIYKTKNFSDWTNYGVPGFNRLGKDYYGNLFAGTIWGSKVYSSSDSGKSWNLIYQKTSEWVITFNFNLTKDSTLLFGGKNEIVTSKTDSVVLGSIPMIDMFSPFLKLDDNDNLYAFSDNIFKYSTDKGVIWYGGKVDFFSGEYLSDFIINHHIIGAFEDQTNWGGHGWGAAVSDDSGKTWRWSTNGLPPYTVGGNLAKSGTDTYLGTWGQGVFKSTDFGDSWSPINNGINAAQVMDLEFIQDSIIYSASWGTGLSKSTDLGNSWKDINNGVSNHNFYSVISDRSGNLFAGNERGGFYKSTDQGESWNLTSFQILPDRLFKDRHDRIYITNLDAGLYRTSDQGNSFQKISNGFALEGVTSFAVDSSDNLYAATQGSGWIYKSTDDGVSWKQIRAGIASSWGIDRLAVASNGYIFAGDLDDGILRSTDDGLTWQQLKTGSLWKYVSGLGINKHGLLFVSLKQNSYFDAPEVVFVSSDNGETFKNCTGNLQCVYVKNIKFYNNKIYIAARDGIYVADVDSITSVESFPVMTAEKYQLFQNYPNPFNPSTEIKYSIPAAGYVSLKVYDILGKEISSLVNEEKQSGEYTVSFNGSRYPSGVYLYTIRSGNFTETKKLMLLK